jgi:hypothetical protein
VTLHSSVDATAHEVMGCSLLTADSGAAAQLKELHGAIDLKPALRLMLEFSVECKDLRAAVEQLGGVVLHEYEECAGDVSCRATRPDFAFLRCIKRRRRRSEINNFFNAPANFSIDNPEPGYMRIVILGDWTNAGNITATLTVTGTNKGTAVYSKYNRISQGELQTIPFTVAAGVANISFQLTWNNDWSHYPTNDLDLIVVDPDGNAIFDGATLNGRETVNVAKPKAGNWTVLVDGFDIFGQLHNDGTQTGPQTDTYRFRVYEQ